MPADIYLMNKLFLKFKDEETEALYKDHIFERTLLFCRITWVLVALLGGSFGLIDRKVFGESADMVLFVRSIMVLFAVLMFAGTFYSRYKKIMELNSCLFILSIGAFCTFLTAMSNPSHFSSYFIGLFIAFTGVLITAGLGFKFSFFALLMNLVIFEIVIMLIPAIPFILFVRYNFFLVAGLMIFGYIGYFIEVISRKNFVVTAQLHDSVSRVRKLSGLLPICASCKKIRDDQGYWSEIEMYICNHSEAEFSHSVCPNCAEKLYPGIVKKRNKTI